MDAMVIWKKLPKYLAITLAIAVGMLLAVRVIDLLMIWGLYGWFFQSITRVGGINEYIAGAASIWFTAAVLLLIPIVLFKFLFRRQTKGLLIIASCFSLWFVILYFLSQPREGEYFNTITGNGRVVWFSDHQGKINILPLGYKFDPHYGIKTQLITTPILLEYERQLGLKDSLERKILDQGIEIKNLKQGLESVKEEIKRKNADTEALGKKIETQHKKQEVVRPLISPGPNEYKHPIFVDRYKNFYITITSAERIGTTTLQINLLVRSRDDGRVSHMFLDKPEETAYIVDPTGNRYGFIGQNYLDGEFPGGVDIQASISFITPPKNVKTINIIFRYCFDDIPGSGTRDVIFRNLDLELIKIITPLKGNNN